jgi:hypothetical protein
MCCNLFIVTKDYLKNECTFLYFQCVSENRLNVAPMSPGDIARELAVIHHLCVCHLDELREMSDRQPSLKRLVAVTEMLTNHKRQYMGDNT